MNVHFQSATLVRSREVVPLRPQRVLAMAWRRQLGSSRRSTAAVVPCGPTRGVL